jgi:organic radical activating enzyme
MCTVVDWNLGSTCNYACSYCPPSLHDGSSLWPDYNTVTTFCDYVFRHYKKLGRNVFFQLSGGEVTLYRSITDLVKFIRTLGAQVGVISNGSRSPTWWGEFAQHLDMAVLTHHIEYAQLEHFIDVVQCVGKHTRTHVNVTMLPTQFEECAKNARAIAERCPEVTITLKPLLINFDRIMYGYTAPQKAAILNWPDRQQTTPMPGCRGLMRKVYDDGSTELVKAAHLIVRSENRWRGWKCNIGVELLSVTKDGSVYRGVCRQGGYLGHIRDKHLGLPLAGIRCEKDVCHCVSDILTSKWNLDVPNERACREQKATQEIV